jgi:hypothetical protein
MYVVVVDSKEARSSYKDNPILTYEGDRFIVLNDDEGWVEATSTLFINGEIPRRAKLFDTEKEAVAFAERWKGHPWWCIPNGNYEIIEIVPKIEAITRLIGYERK